MSYDVALDRLRSTHWDSWKPKRVPIYFMLLKEYLRRIASWSVALNIDIDKLEDVRERGWCIYDVSRFFLRSNHNDDSSLESDLKMALGVYFDNRQMKKVAISYLHWQEVSSNAEVIALNLPCPYEPLIIMYELGELDYRVEHNAYFDLTSGGMQKMKWRSYLNFEPLDISKENLAHLESLL